jgi:thioredoxin
MKKALLLTLTLNIFSALPADETTAATSPAVSLTHQPIIELNGANFDQEVLSSNLPVIIDIYADWCGPCKALRPLLQEMCNKYKDQVKFTKLNIDDQPTLARRYHVTAVPTLVFVKKGEVVAETMGLPTQVDFEAKIEALLN